MIINISSYWMDERRNKWSTKLYTKDKAINCSNTLINCYDCINCNNCINCYFVVGSSNCKNMANSWGCNNCQDLVNVYFKTNYKGKHPIIIKIYLFIWRVLCW